MRAALCSNLPAFYFRRVHPGLSLHAVKMSTGRYWVSRIDRRTMESLHGEHQHTVKTEKCRYVGQTLLFM